MAVNKTCHKTLAATMARDGGLAPLRGPLGSSDPELRPVAHGRLTALLLQMDDALGDLGKSLEEHLIALAPILEPSDGPGTASNDAPASACGHHVATVRRQIAILQAITGHLRSATLAIEA